MSTMRRDDFEHLVDEAIGALPTEFSQRLDNVEIVVEGWPDPETLRLAQVRHRTELLGFYHGIPQTKRTHQYGLILPDKISIYQHPIEMRCVTPEQIQDLVFRVVRHEVAHHFGIDDQRLKEINAY
ncbi:MAG: metallopeptidase family protein [Anaerolineae bacterium]|nr:metallopeptidase family protein [Anaerolineae bacterium]